MIDRFSIVTLVVFALSTVFVIHPLSFRISGRIPVIGGCKISIDLRTAPILSILILWVSQCIDARVVRDGIVGSDDIKPYNILILFISLAYMAITLDITGVLNAAAYWVNNRGGSNGRLLYFYFYAMLTFLSVLLGNDPVILSGTAFLYYFTKVAEIDPTAWVISEFAAANTASMVLFVGNPTNVVICEGFRVNNAAFTAYTILPFLACSTACYAALFFQFRDARHLPRKLEKIAKLDPRDVLLDPFGAWVGSILLGTCLVVIIIVSFFGIDVWKISLPFAVAKFFFDLGWDHYRHSKGQLRSELPPPPIDDDEEPAVSALKRAMSMPYSITETTTPLTDSPSTTESATTQTLLLSTPRNSLQNLCHKLSVRFPTIFTAWTRLPFGLIPFAFSQFILIQGLAHRGWIDIFARWLVILTKGRIYPTIWIVGVFGVILCNLAGTNIGATILLTKVVRAAPGFPIPSMRAAAIALAVASNIGAVSFTFSASLAGLLWKEILNQKGISMTQTSFARWNLLPLAVMTCVGLAVVSGEMAVLY